MPMEHAVEEVNADGVPLNFDFDSAYWMSQLEPADTRAGVARFDGRSLAIPEHPTLVRPEAGGPTTIGQTGPYTMTGLAWLDDPSRPTPPRVNGFDVTLAGARAVRLDLTRMRVDASRPILGIVRSDRPLELRLDGSWATAPVVRSGGRELPAAVDGSVLRIELPAGSERLTIS
jgi:hypothetical protein